MIKQFKSFSRIAVIALASGGLCLGVSAQAAQKKEEPKAEQPSSKSSKSPSPAASTAALSAKDKAFMKEAAKGGQMEVDMGKMAQAKGKNAEVKKIGSRMVADHSKANAELMAIAKKKGVDLSKEKPMTHKMDDANFDKQYIDMMVKDHEKDVAEFQAEAKNGSDADVKAFASKTSEVIKKHLALVKAAQSKIK
ncbi:MAG: putative rane protein [Verrucomicrobiota bacterium]|jgi:putative membrane protein